MWPARFRAPRAPSEGRPGAFDREVALERLRQEVFDVVVVGGGITGCGVALDAAARGLRTALVEAGDFGSGTSSKSSKLVHGGLRYLQHREYRLVHDALTERRRLLHNAPHLVQRVAFLIPLFGRDGVRTEGLAKAYSTALWVYDLAGGSTIGRRHRRITAADAHRHVPWLRTDQLVAGFVYWDAQVDDARLTLAVARTAAARGAVMVNRAPVAAILPRTEGDGVVTVRLGDGTDVRARVVVNAGGVWSGEIAALAPSGRDAIRIRPAKGVHITVAASRLPCDQAVVLAVPGARRSIFVVPWDAAQARRAGGAGRYTYIGTTDTDYDGSLDRPDCTAEDIAGLLAAVNAWTTVALGPDDVSGAWAGLRPLVRGESNARTADLSRRHRILTDGDVVTVTGGKLTTYRAMAADTVDEVTRLLGRRRSRSPTRRLRLLGADGVEGVARRGGVLGLPGIRAHLIGRYGAEATTVASLADADMALAGPLVPGLPYLCAEAVFAARQEMATTLLDVLSRRTRALILDRHATLAAAPAVARLLAGELGWSDARVEAEVASVASVLRAEEVAAGTGQAHGDAHKADRPTGPDAAEIPALDAPAPETPATGAVAAPETLATGAVAGRTPPVVSEP